MKFLKILEIGAGRVIYKGKGNEKVIHLDKIKLPHIEVVHDLNNFPYPFKNNEFDEIIASHVLEHLDDIAKVMEELYRILKPNGILKVYVPYFSSPLAFIDTTHKHFFTFYSLDYWDPTTEIGQICRHEVGKNAKFKIIKKEFHFYNFLKVFLIDKFAKRFPKVYEFSFLSKIFPAWEIYFELKAIK